MKNYPACKELNPHKTICGPTHEIKQQKSIGRTRVNSSWNKSYRHFIFILRITLNHGKYSKIANTLHVYFSDYYDKIPVVVIIRAGIIKVLVRIANREDPDQKQSDLGSTV